MKKALLLTLEYPPQQGGVAEYLRCLVEASDGRIEVASVTPLLSSWLRPRWLPVLFLALRLRPSVMIVSHVLPIGEIAWILHKLFRARYVVLLHGNDIGIIRAANALKKHRVTRILRSADMVIANSHHTAEIAKQFGAGKNLSVAYPCPAFSEVTTVATKTADIFTILTACRLVHRKGVDVLIRALAELRKKNIPAKLVIAGDGSDRDSLPQLAKSLGIADYVMFLGKVAAANMPQRYATADVFAMTPREPWPDVEGFGMVYLEAALFAVPSVGSKTGGVPEAVLHEKTGLIVLPDDVQATADALEKLYLDPVLRKKLGEQARERTRQEFTWKKQLAPLLKWL